MYAIALSIIVICLLVITYKKPRLGFVVLGLLLITALIFYWLTPTGETLKKADPLTEYAALSNTSVKVGYADSFLLTGRVINQHPTMSVEEVSIQSKVSLCKTQDIEDCVVLGDETNLLKEYIPARQARDFSINLQSRLLADEEGVISWEHILVNAK